MSIDNTIPLCTLRGVIASLTIENPCHWKEVYFIDTLIAKFGPLRRIDWNLFFRLSHRDEV